MNELKFGDRLEVAYSNAKKEVKVIGRWPVSFCSVLIDGVFVEITKSVSHPWTWKLTNKESGRVTLIHDKWGLCYVEEV